MFDIHPIFADPIISYRVGYYTSKLVWEKVYGLVIKANHAWLKDKRHQSYSLAKDLNLLYSCIDVKTKEDNRL